MNMYKTKVNKENIKLAWGFEVASESCKNPLHYSDYLRMNALPDLEAGLGVTYFFVDCDVEAKFEKLMGYMTLRVTSLIKESGENKRYGYPALEIAKLAVDKNYIGNSLGTDMVMDAINTANELNEIISIKYVVLCADPTAVAFYKKKPLEFKNMYDDIEDIPREHCNLECVPRYIKLR